MTSDRIFNALADYLLPLVTKAGGVFSPSETVAETLSLLATGPTTFRCILQWQRDDDTRTRGELGAKFLLIIQQGKSLNIAKGADATVGRDSLLVRFNKAAQWMRAVRFMNDDISSEPMKQLSAYWMHDPSIPTRQIAGEFMVNYGQEAVDIVNLTIK